MLSGWSYSGYKHEPLINRSIFAPRQQKEAKGIHKRMLLSSKDIVPGLSNAAKNTSPVLSKQFLCILCHFSFRDAVEEHLI